MDRSIEIRLPDQTAFELSGRTYLTDWAIPQFFFHLVMAYAVMRHKGAPLGKADHVPHVFRHVRTETA